MTYRSTCSCFVVIVQMSCNHLLRQFCNPHLSDKICWLWDICCDIAIAILSAAWISFVMASPSHDLDFYGIYTIQIGGKSVKLKKEQVTTAVLGQIFDLFPDSIILISEEGYVCTPNVDGTFKDINDLSMWVCQGKSCRSASMSEEAGLSTSYPHQSFQYVG